MLSGRTKAGSALRIVRKAGVLRARELSQWGLARQYLSRLCRLGLVERVGRGLYVATDAGPNQYQSIAEVCKRVPHGVVCLLSALRFHELTTQAPFEVWLAIEEKAWTPKIDYPAVRLMRFSGRALTEGIQEHTVGGVKLRVYSPAKTVADCFKYRNKIGKDVAVEALRDCWRQQSGTMGDLWHFAKVCREANVMRPYLESIV